MARARIPGPLERRHLVEKQLPPAQALGIAEAYLAEERCIEAVGFLALANDAERLAALRERALDAGDLFLLRTVAEAHERPPTREEWQRLATSADAHGLERYAAEARRQAERGER